MITDISASEVAAILGLSPWQSPMDVWLRKSGVVADTSSDATRRGHMLESAIIDRWWQGLDGPASKGVRMLRGPTLDHEPYRRDGQPWVCARPDAVLQAWSGAPIAVMDAKSARRLSEDHGWLATPEGVPDHYACQLLWQCAAVGVEDAHLAAYGTQYDEWRTYRLHVPESHQRAVIAAVGDWRERHLLAEVPPPIDGTDGWSAHIRRLYPGRAKVPDLTATEHDRALARDLARVRA